MKDNLAFLLYHLGCIAAGVGLCATLTGTPWLGLSIICVGIGIYWSGWEIQRAQPDPEDDEP